MIWNLLFLLWLIFTKGNGMLFRITPIFVILMLITSSCTIREKGNKYPGESPEEALIHKKCDDLDNEIWKQFAINPDSAEKLLISSNDSFDLWGHSYKKVYLEMQLCELYQYRKPDKVKALERLERALKLLLHGNQPMPDSTYLFIDIGNVFFRFNLYLHAMSFYRVQYNITGNTTYWHRRMLAAQNIALVWSALHQTDSAIWYLRQADSSITDRFDLSRARNNQLLQVLLLEKLDFSDSEKLLDTACGIMFRFKNARLIDPESKTARLTANWYEIMAEIHHTRFLQYQRQKNLRDAELHLDSAILYSREAQSVDLPVGYYIDKVRISGNSRNIPELIRYTQLTDSAIRASADIRLRKSLADSLASALHSGNQPHAEKLYRDYSAGLEDTLTLITRASAPLILNVMQLSVVVLSRYLIGLHDREAAKNEIIAAQRRTILFSLTLTALIMLFVTIFFYQKSRIYKAYKATVYQFNQRIIEEERSNVKKNTTDSSFDFPDEKLRQIMHQDKPYLQTDLSLNALADKIGTNRTYLSTYLNSTLQTDFNSFINEYRVREACRLLVSPEMSHLKIDALAQMAGFKSRASFYSAFSNLTGMTPAVYKKLNSRPA